MFHMRAWLSGLGGITGVEGGGGWTGGGVWLWFSDIDFPFFDFAQYADLICGASRNFPRKKSLCARTALR
jgi:hypothetical protein